MMDLKLPFGMRDGRLVHISEVERGLKCGCLCPSCSHQLVARKGEQVVHHFAHHKGEDCKGAVETALHLAAKQILEEERRIKLPYIEFFIPWAFGGLYSISEEQTVEVESVKLEDRFDNIVPDVLVYVKGWPLMIEVTVTHGIDQNKMDKIKKLGISTLEISLKDMDRSFNPENLRAAVIDSPWGKGWVYSAKYEREKAVLIQYSDKKKIYEGRSRSYVRDCPIKARVNRAGKSYAYAYSDCIDCCYRIVKIEKNYDYEEEDEGDDDEQEIYCEDGVFCIARNYQKKEKKVIDIYEKIGKTFHW